ncbi:MAG: hypothetical protein LLG00_07815 [Planctomycetaceae bacterium]|nr:hypothetical protein [Planctomycetaceae bacterium]
MAFLLGEQRAAQRLSHRLFGRSLRRWEYAGLTGAPNLATVEVGATEGRLYLELRDPVSRMRGYYYLFRDGTSVVLLNDAIRIDVPEMRGRGLGLQMFRRQVRNAAALGVDRIETVAGRGRDENGYYTWPRYGFDGAVPAPIQRLLPSGLRRRRTIADLMSCEKGRKWWKEHGVPMSLRFDLAASSTSRRALARYVRARRCIATNIT